MEADSWYIREFWVEKGRIVLVLVSVLVLEVTQELRMTPKDGMGIPVLVPEPRAENRESRAQSPEWHVEISHPHQPRLTSTGIDVSDLSTKSFRRERHTRWTYDVFTGSFWLVYRCGFICKHHFCFRFILFSFQGKWKLLLFSKYLNSVSSKKTFIFTIHKSCCNRFITRYILTSTLVLFSTIKFSY